MWLTFKKNCFDDVAYIACCFIVSVILFSLNPCHPPCVRLLIYLELRSGNQLSALRLLKYRRLPSAVPFDVPSKLQVTIPGTGTISALDVQTPNSVTGQRRPLFQLASPNRRK